MSRQKKERKQNSKTAKKKEEIFEPSDSNIRPSALILEVPKLDDKPLADKKSSAPARWIDGRQLKARWMGLSHFEILRFIFDNNLPAFDPQMNRFIDPGNREDHYLYGIDIENYIEDLQFQLTNIEDFEKSNKMFFAKVKINKKGILEELSPKELRELGRLRLEKKKWDDSLTALVVAMEFARDQNIRITKKQLWDELRKKGLDSIPQTAFDKVWKALPEKYRNIGGAPPKEPQLES